MFTYTLKIQMLYIFHMEFFPYEIVICPMTDAFFNICKNADCRGKIP